MGEKHQKKAKNSTMTDKVIHLIKDELCAHQSSPEQIRGRLQLNNEIYLNFRTPAEIFTEALKGVRFNC